MQTVETSTQEKLAELYLKTTATICSTFLTKVQQWFGQVSRSVQTSSTSHVCQPYR